MEEPSKIASFDTWTAMFLFASSLGLFLAFILLSDKKGRRDNWPIALIVTGFSLILIQYVFNWTAYRGIYHYAYFFDSAWYLSFGPLFYIYIIRFYKKDFKINFAHFVPALVVFVLSVFYLVRTDGFLDLSEVKGEMPLLNMIKMEKTRSFLFQPIRAD